MISYLSIIKYIKKYPWYKAMWVLNITEETVTVNYS